MLAKNIKDYLKEYLESQIISDYVEKKYQELSEILSLKVPSILIPSPYVANNHQYYNALDLVNLKVAELIEEKNLNDNIIKVMVNELVYNDKLYNEFKNNLEALNTKESSSIIYDEIKELIK